MLSKPISIRPSCSYLPESLQDIELLSLHALVLPIILVSALSLPLIGVSVSIKCTPLIRLYHVECLPGVHQIHTDPLRRYTHVIRSLNILQHFRILHSRHNVPAIFETQI